MLEDGTLEAIISGPMVITEMSPVLPAAEDVVGHVKAHGAIRKGSVVDDDLHVPVKVAVDVSTRNLHTRCARGC